MVPPTLLALFDELPFFLLDPFLCDDEEEEEKEDEEDASLDPPSAIEREDEGFDEELEEEEFEEDELPCWCCNEQSDCRSGGRVSRRGLLDEQSGCVVRRLCSTLMSC